MASSSIGIAIKQEVAKEAQQSAGNAFLGELKSEAAAGNLKTVLILGAVGGVVAGLAWVGMEEEERKKHKHYKEIKLVEENHTNCLTKIRVSPTEDIALPTIFETDKDSGLLHAQKDYKTIEELRNMIKQRPSVGFPTEVNDEISRALLNLLIFHEDRIKRGWFWQGTEGDVTSAFLRYHIARLYEYGRKFQGTEYTAAVLTALHKSINEFRIQHGIKAERFGYLDRVCLPLKAAIIALNQHSKELTLADIIAGAVPDCDELSIKLMHNLTKLVTPAKYWENFESGIDPMLLEQNMIRQKVPHTNIFSNSKQLELHLSSVGQNIRKVAANYNVTHGLRTAGSTSAPVQASLNLKTADFTEAEQKLNFDIFTQNSQHLGFRGSPFGRRISNFMTTTTRLGAHGKENEILPITVQEDMIYRLGLMNKLAELNNDGVEITKLFLRLKNYIEIEGDKKSANPNNAEVHYMCDVLLALGAKLRKDADACERGLDKVELDHQYRTLEPAQAKVLMETRMVVQSLKEEVDRSLQKITDYRSKTHYEALEKEIKVHEDETLQTFADVANNRGLKVPQRIAKPPKDKNKIAPPPVSTGLSTVAISQPGVNNAASVVDSEMKYDAHSQPVPPVVNSNFAVSMALSASSTAAKPLASAMPIPIPLAKRPVPSSQVRVRVEVKPEMVDQLLTAIAAKIKVIGTEEFKEPYEKIHVILAKLHTDYFAMHGDANSDRRLKAEKVKDLSYELCQFTLAFLELPVEQRRLGFKMFAVEIDAKVNRPENKYFVDKHFGSVAKFLESHKEGWMGYFYSPPDTRQDLEKLSEACHRLSKP